MAWMDGTAEALWGVLLLVCVVLTVLVVIAAVSLLRRPPAPPPGSDDRRRLDQEFAAGRISEQDYRAGRTEQSARSTP